jgi:hypothetical protein
MVLVYCVKHAFHPDVLSSLLSFISGACSTAKVNTELYYRQGDGKGEEK